MNKLLLIIYSIIMKIVPIKENRIFFTSLDGHYSDNPLVISELIHKIAPDIEIIWSVNEEYLSILPDYVKGVKLNSFNHYYYKGTCKIHIDNVYGDRAVILHTNKLKDKIKFKFLGFILNKKNQKLFTTWHGYAFKKIGRAQLSNNYVDFTCPNTEMIVGSEFSKKCFDYATFNKLKMSVMGTPRNHILLQDSDKKNEYRIKLGLPTDKNILIYAPTFRNDGRDVENKNIRRSGLDQLELIDFNVLSKALKEKFGGEWVFVLRFHYHVENMVDWNNLYKKYGNIIINGNQHDDMNEYLCSSDILVTDASSSVFDFVLTSNPCFLFFPDFKNYNEKERGLFVEIENLPFAKSETFDEFLNDIKSFDYTCYKQKTDKMMKDMGYAEKIDSAMNITKYILNEMKSK